MFRVLRWLAGVLALTMILVAAAALSAAADLLVNGSFETGPSMPTGTMVLPDSSTLVAGWMVTSGSVDYYDVSFWETEDGVRSIGLNGFEPGAISQTFTTIPGKAYTVSFWMAGEPFTQPVIKHLRVAAAGVSADYAFDSAPSWHWSMGWQHHTFNFAAIAGSTTITISSLDAGDESPVVDNVAIAPAAAGVDGGARAGLWLAAPRPNPVHARARFEYSLAGDGPATLSVVDLSGRTIATLASGWHAAGAHSARWTPAEGNGRAGVYFLRLASREGSRSERFTYLP